MNNVKNKKNKFYVTTPIYYVNDVPHIGSAYTTIAADVLARYHKMIGERTFFMTGTDEHGAKIEAKAAEAGKKPQVFVDEVAAAYIAAWQELGIAPGRFLRTTEPEHIKAVQNALQLMYDKGDIYSGKYEGLYCRGCEQFKSERDLIDGKCPDHGTVPEKMSEDCYMFKLSKYRDELLRRIKSDELSISPKERKHEIVSFYEKEGLNDIAFSRKKVKWGIPLPWDPGQTAYVWADAFLNYLTGLGWDGAITNSHESDTNSHEIGGLAGNAGGSVNRFWPPDVQLMSKDILRVHATIWPAMLLSLGLPLQKEIFVHGFFLVDGKKMSKSLGNVIRPGEMVKRYGADATRYLLLSATPFGHDGDIGWQKFDEKYNADLANGLGNLVARVSNLLEKNEIKIDIEIDHNGELARQFDEKIKALSLDGALEILWRKQRLADETLSARAPWKMTEKEEIKKVLAPIAQNILDIAFLLQPFMPEIAGNIVEQFTQKQIKKGEPLFPRL